MSDNAITVLCVIAGLSLGAFLAHLDQPSTTPLPDPVQHKPTALSCSRCPDPTEPAEPVELTGPAVLDFGETPTARTQPVLRWCHGCGVWYTWKSELPRAIPVEARKVEDNAKR